MSRAIARGGTATALVTGVLVAAVGGACGGAPGPGAHLATASAGAAGCSSCHADIAQEWQASFHRTAFSDSTFQASLALEEPKDRAFCTNCHAPTHVAAEGVGCASCHAAPHRREPASLAAASCAPCHEFTFEGRSELVQKTASEHRGSAFAGTACVACHMPQRSGHRDHRFVSGHAPGAFAPAVHVSASRSGSSVQVAIRVDAGHDFPTGDMFRRARLLVFAEREDGQIVADAERVFGRTWGAIAHGPDAGARTQLTDSRIRGTWQETIPLDADTPVARVRYTLLYERLVAASGDHVSVRSSDALVEGEAR